MGKRSREDGPGDTPVAPFHSPFAALGGLRAALPAGEAPSAAPPPAEPLLSSPSRPRAPERAVIRRERKGRGGKDVTCVELRGLPDAALPEWLTALKRALGCGGAVEGGALVLQGDQRERVRAWLAEQGVRKISLG